MIQIIKLDSYTDGGTISLKCLTTNGGIYFSNPNILHKIWSNYLDDRWGPDDEVEICLDGRFGKEPKLWIGYPEESHSKPIVEEILIDYILNKVSEWKELQNSRTDQFLNYHSKLRDWKISKVIDKS